MTFLFFVGRHIAFEIKWNFNRIRTNAKGNANHSAYLSCRDTPSWCSRSGNVDSSGIIRNTLSVCCSYLVYAIEIDVSYPPGKNWNNVYDGILIVLFCRSMLIVKSPRRLPGRYSRFSKLRKRVRERGGGEGGRGECLETLKLGGSPVISQISGDVRLI